MLKLDTSIMHPISPSNQANLFPLDSMWYPFVAQDELSSKIHFLREEVMNISEFFHTVDSAVGRL